MQRAETPLTFRSDEGRTVPAVTAAQMREVDRIAVEIFGLTILQMMENAGRNLAGNVIEMLGDEHGQIAVLAGSGGNGGGGLCCARHLHNRGFTVWIVLSKDASNLKGAAHHQLHILQAAGIEPVEPSKAEEVIRRADVVVDALIGYSLRGAPRGRAAELIEQCNAFAARVLALDVPSGLDATTGETPGAVVQPERTLTLALPKTGLQGVPGELYLADIGIPPAVYDQLGLAVETPFRGRYWLKLTSHQNQAEEQMDRREKQPAWITTIDEDEAGDALAEAYQRCADKNTGRAAHIMKVHSLSPQSMLDHRALYRTLMFGPSPLKRYQREMIGVVTAALNQCEY